MNSSNNVFPESILIDNVMEYMNHGAIVGNLAKEIAKRMGMDEEFCYDMSIAGMMHDIGKVKIRTYIEERFEKVMFVDEARYYRMHPTTGYALLKEQGFSDRILTAVLDHHENYDGSGYPNNLKGEGISVEGRILHICDSFGRNMMNQKVSSWKDLRIDEAMRDMVEEAKDFDMKIFLLFQAYVYSEEFQNFLEELDLRMKDMKDK
ncbi:MAG: HD domain-containing protein [Lachnospiraceae bacterium]|nr:HD domain-containing protein [Lachnospiraceae bacterium]